MNEKKTMKIAMLGTGAMGSRVARNFLKAGFDVTVYNRTPERARALAADGAKLAATPKEAAENADFVFSMVRDTEASREVWLADETGAIHGLREENVAIESSTVTPGWVRELSAAIAAHTSAAFLDAPVLGTRPQADAAALIYLVAGDEQVLEKTREVLQKTSGAIHRIGTEAGAATALKLMVNAQYGVQVAIWAETLTVLEKSGIAEEAAVEILNTLPTTSAALQIGGKLMAAKNYAAMFPIELVEKDFGYALEFAANLGLDTPTIAAVRHVYAEARAQGYGDDNIIGIKQLYADSK